MASCVLTPFVSNSKGETTTSKLFQDISSLSHDRKATIVLWSAVTSESFREQYGNQVEYDENGEPTLRSITQLFNIEQFIPHGQIQRAVQRYWGAQEDVSKAKTYEDTPQNRDELEKQAMAFNDTSMFRDMFTASIKVFHDAKTGKRKIRLTIQDKTTDNENLPDDIKRQHLLNQRLRELLEKWGIPVEALSELEEELGINGVTMFGTAEVAAKGFMVLIQLAKGIRGEMALPEEFSHVIIRAMHNDPFVKRLLTLLNNNDALLEEIFGEDYDIYKQKYNNDRQKLVEEAAGKLLAKHFIEQETIPQKPYRNILQKVIDAIKRFFSRFNASHVAQAMDDVNAIVGNIANRVLTEQVTAADFDWEQFKTSDRMLNVTKDKVENSKTVLEQIRDTELKKYNILKRKLKGKKYYEYTEQHKKLIESIEKSMQDSDELVGITTYLTQAIDQLKYMQQQLRLIEQIPDINKRARLLRDVRLYIDSYTHIIQVITPRLDTMLKEVNPIEQYETSENYDFADAFVIDPYSGKWVKSSQIGRTPEETARKEAIQKLQDCMATVTGIVGLLDAGYQAVAKPLFAQAIEPIIGDGITLTMGKHKGRKITVDEILSKSDRDISFWDRWLDSAADSQDYMIKIIDQMVKKAKNTARLKTIDYKKRIMAAGIRLEQAGVIGFDWMFEYDEKGHKTGKYIAEYNWKQYNEDKKAFMKSLDDRYGEVPTDPDKYIAKNRELKQWTTIHLSKDHDGDTVPNPRLYRNPAFEKLSAAQKEFYHEMMSIKKDLDDLLPDHVTYLRNAIKIRKDLVERVKSSKDVTSGVKEIWHAIKDAFIRRSDDNEFGGKAALQDFSGKQVETLPIYYTELKEGESADDISTDVVSTMIAYAAMANDYDQMDQIIDTLEVGREVAAKRLIPQRSGGKNLMEHLSIQGKEQINPLYKPEGQSNAQRRLDDYFSMQVYGRYMADEGTFGDTKVDVAKTLGVINHITVLNTFAMNLLAGISNIATGTVMMNIEAAASQFFTPSDLVTADKIYAQASPSFAAQIGKRVKTSKLALIDEMFNVLQDYEQETRDLNFDRRTWFSRMMNSDIMFFYNNIGEHWMQNRTFLALAVQYKLKDANGNETNLWDALEVTPIDKSHPERGAKLTVKEGTTTMDGKKFELTDDVIYKLTRRAAAINQHMHGIYNKIDRAAIQKLGVGRLAMTFRKYIKPSINKRFGYAGLNLDLGVETEGYYRTAGRFLLNTIKGLKNSEYTIATSWNNLDEKEKKNIIRAVTEIGQFAAISALLLLVQWPDDKKNRPWHVRMLEYQMRRLYTEMGAFVPGPQMISEGLRILKSPAAAINQVENALDLVGLINPYNYEVFAGEDAIVQSGRYKGLSKAERLIWESPFIPLQKTIYRGFHPEEGIPFYKQ